jgi:hypothetical protein
MTHRFGRIRRFRFNRPQQIAAVLLAMFLAQGLWLIARQPVNASDALYAGCGSQLWLGQRLAAGGENGCGSISDGILAYRLAGLPLALDRLAGLGQDHSRGPQSGALPANSMNCGPDRLSQIVLILIRLPFLLAGFFLGGALWWVTRRLYGNLGGYTALALYCFSPAVVRAAAQPGPDLLAALGVFGGVYTCIGVAHAMQGPRRKWRPRMVLLAAAFGLAGAAHLAALALTALLGLGFMLWVAEGRRRQVFPVVLIPALAALLFLFVCYGFSPSAFGELFVSPAAFASISLAPIRRFSYDFGNLGLLMATVTALLIYLLLRKARYFGNTAPLLCALVCILLVPAGSVAAAWLWALPFLLTFLGGVLADAYDEPRGRLARATAGVLVVVQVTCCLIRLTFFF